MKRLLSICLAVVLVVAVALTFAPASVVALDGFLFEDDFESYSVGAIPSPNWWAWAAYSVDRPTRDDRVRLFEGNQVFALHSDFWAAVASANIAPLLDYSIEADIYMMPRGGTPPRASDGAGFYLRTVNRNTVHLSGGYGIKFQPDSDRVAVWILDRGNPNTLIGEAPYQFDYYTWYRVKASVTGDEYGEIKIQLFVNDMTTPVLEMIDDGTRWQFYRGDVAGYTNLTGYYSGPIYYDNIKIYEYVLHTPPPPPVEVGGDVYPVNKIAILAPWIVLAVAIIAGTSVAVRRRTGTDTIRVIEKGTK